MKWFPMFIDERTHPLVTGMRPGLFRFWINLRCATVLYKGGGNLKGIEATAFTCRTRRGLTARYLDELIALDLASLDEHGGYAARGLPGMETIRPPENEWAQLRSQVFARDDFTCAYCGERGGRLECDHVIPVSRGGSNDLENLATACFACNRSKHDKLIGEWF